MAATTKFISKADFKPYQVISSYQANSITDFHILNAQRNHIRPILGDATHTALQTAAEAGTETADELALIAKIKPLLVYRTMQEYLGDANLFFTNMGARVLNDEQSREANQEERQRIGERCKTNAAIYEAELWEFLDDNKATYTTWRDDTQRFQCAKRNLSGFTVVRSRDIGDRKAGVYDRDF